MENIIWIRIFSRIIWTRDSPSSRVLYYQSIVFRHGNHYPLTNSGNVKEYSLPSLLHIHPQTEENGCSDPIPVRDYEHVAECLRNSNGLGPHLYKGAIGTKACFSQALGVSEGARRVGERERKDSHL
jgi:hypothetical protein